MLNLLKSVGSWFAGSLFGGSGTADKKVNNAMEIARGVGTYIDELNVTDEERIKMHAENMKSMHTFINATQDEHGTRSITRRYLAWFIVGQTFLILNIALVFQIQNKKDVVKEIVDLADAFNIGWAFVAVVVFYFGATWVRSRESK